MYSLKSIPRFDRKVKKFIKNNNLNSTRLSKTLKKLETDPFDSSLKTHPVNSRLFGFRYSSRVTGDVRIIWRFGSENSIVILLLDLGGHSGKAKVYK